MPRAWYRGYFTDHPAYIDGNSPSDVFTGHGRTRDKVKVWCTECYNSHLAEVMPQALRHVDRSDPARFEFECRLWNEPNATWVTSRRNACLLHLRDCLRQPSELRDRAASQHESYLEHRRGRDKTLRDSRRPSTQSEPADALLVGGLQAGGSLEAGPANSNEMQLVTAVEGSDGGIAAGYNAYWDQPEGTADSYYYNSTDYPHVQDNTLSYTLPIYQHHGSNSIPQPPAGTDFPYHQGAQVFAESPYSPHGARQNYNIHMGQGSPPSAPYSMWAYFPS